MFNLGNLLDDNLMDEGNDGLPEGRTIHNDSFQRAGARIMSEPYNNPTIPVTVLSPQEAFLHIAAQAGNSLYRDPVDQRPIDHLLSHGALGYIPANEGQVGGMPSWEGGPALLDSDNDGIPDS